MSQTICNQAASNDPEFIRVADIPKRFGLGRSTTYALLREGKIQGFKVRGGRGRAGTRLISVASIRSFIHSSPVTGIFNSK